MCTPQRRTFVRAVRTARLRRVIVVGLLAAPIAAAAPVIEIARRAAGSGAKVEVVGLVPGTAEWDKVLFELTAAGVGHATVVRSAAPRTEPPDLDLALRYLPDIRCVVLVAPPALLVATALGGAEFVGAPLVVVGPLEPDVLAAFEGRSSGSAGSIGSATPIILDPPSSDPDATFAGFVATLASRLDAGEAPDAAFRSTVSALGVDPA